MRNTILVGGALLLIPYFSLAAFSGLVLSQTPEVPTPGTDVRVTATVIDRDVSQMAFTWTVDGEVVLDAVGQTSLTVVAPQPGDERVVSVEARDAQGVYATESLRIAPAALYLEWEGRSSAPPFYIGKRLVGPMATVVVSAVPNFVYASGSRAETRDIFFDWRVNGEQRIKPTLGRSSASFDLPLFNRPFLIEVTASTRDGRLSGKERVAIIPTNPKIVVYETSPLGGLLDRSAVVGTLPFREAEVTLTAFPLYGERRDLLSFAWSLNRSPIETVEGASHTVTFRKTGEGEGRYSVETSYENPLRFVERATHSFLLQF